MWKRLWKEWSLLAIVILTSLGLSPEAAEAGCRWSRVKGAVCSLDSSAEKLRKRIACLEYRGPCTQIAMNLEQATCRLKETIYQDAEWPIVECALRDVKMWNSQMVSCVAHSCVLREDRRLQAELQRFQDHLCRTHEQIQITLDKLRCQPGCRYPIASGPRGNPRIGNSPWFQGYPGESLHDGYRDERAFADEFAQPGFDDRAPQFQLRQEWNPTQPPAIRREQLMPGQQLMPGPGPQIRVQNGELGREMLKLVLSRVLD